MIEQYNVPPRGSGVSYGGKRIYADISETTIASEAMKRGGSFMDDRYRVRMEITPPHGEAVIHIAKFLKCWILLPHHSNASTAKAETEKG